MAVSRFNLGAVVLLMPLVSAHFAHAQTAATGSGQGYPNKSVRIVTASAGSGIDFNARQVAQGLTDVLGQ